MEEKKKYADYQVSNYKSSSVIMKANRYKYEDK